jgi:hypothetical protein
VATQGRSLWMLDDLTVIHQLETAKKGDKNYLFAPKSTYRTKGRGGNASNTAGTNLENGVITYFNIDQYDEKKDSIHLTYLDLQGDTLASFSNFDKKKEKKLKVEKGANKFVWNTRTEGAEEFDGMILWWASLNGAKVVPGKYKVNLMVNGKEQTRPFEILADPRAEVNLEQMQQQYDFVFDVNQTIDKAHKSIKKIRKINAQLSSFIKQYENEEAVSDLVAKAKELKKSFSEIEKALYQTKNKSNQDPLNFPIKLTNKLAHLNSLVTMDDFPPTAQDIAVKNELSAQINTELDTFDTLITQEIKSFNDSFNSLKLDYLILE